MAEKTSGYTEDAASKPIQNDDYIDFSNFLSGSTWDVSKKIKVSEFITFLNSNADTFYNANGEFTANRLVTMNGFGATFENGLIINKAGLNDVGYSLQDSLGVEKGNLGYDVGLDSAVLELKNASGAYFTASDGFVGLGTATQSASELLRINGTSLFDGDVNVSGANKLKVGTSFEATTQSGLGSVGIVGHDLTNYAMLIGTGTAATILNAATAKNVEIRINNVQKWTFNGDSLLSNMGLGFKLGVLGSISGFGHQTNEFQSIVNADSNDFTWIQGDTSTHTELVRITGMGELGVGTETPTAFGDFAASETGRASIRMRTGVTPTSIFDGDMWQDGTDFKIRINGVTKTVTLS